MPKCWGVHLMHTRISNILFSILLLYINTIVSLTEYIVFVTSILKLQTKVAIKRTIILVIVYCNMVCVDGTYGFNIKI